MGGIVRLMMLAVFSGLSMNLILQFGLGLSKIALVENPESADKINDTGSIHQTWMLFVTVLFLWLLFSFFRSVIPMGFIEYVLLFPSAYLLFSVLETAVEYFILKKSTGQGGGLPPEKGPSADSIHEDGMTNGALAAAALFITLNMAGNFLEAAVLALFFSAGIALAVLIMNQIRLRSEMEAVPQFLRGSPLILVAMGLLSLVFSLAALMLYRILGAG
jgi:electron transport complex protein RnfA